MRKLLLTLFTLITLTAIGQKPCTPPSIMFILPPMVYCSGDTVPLGVNASGGNTPYTYLWEPTGDTTSTIRAILDSTTTFTVTVTNSCGASAIKSVTIPVTKAIVSIPPATYMIPGDSVILVATGNGVSYQWSPSNVRCLNPPLCDSVKAGPPTATVYTVTATDSAGCQAYAIDTVFMSAAGVAPILGQQQIIVYPNPSLSSFTLKLEKESQLKICDLTGRILFSQMENAGTVSFGEELTPGMYFLFVDSKQAVKLIKL